MQYEETEAFILYHYYILISLKGNFRMLQIPIDAEVHHALGTHLLDTIDLWVRWISKPVYSHIYSIDS